MTFFVRLKDSIGRISAPSADIIPKWEYIRTPSADINKLGESFINMKGDGN